MNPNYTRINAEAAVKDPHSVYHFWGAVLGLRKKYLDVFVYGNYKLVDAGSEEIFAYSRQYEGQKAVVVANWTEGTLRWDAAAKGVVSKTVLLDTYEDVETVGGRFAGETWELRPFEAVVVLVE